MARLALGLGLRTRARRLRNRAAWLGKPILSARAGNALVARIVSSGRPAAMGKYGGVELDAILRYLGAPDPTGAAVDWSGVSTNLYVNAGVYPEDPAVHARFCELMLETLSELDVLAICLAEGEATVSRRYAPQAKPVRMRSLEGYYHRAPWTAQLAGKRVLVVTPFTASVERQYQRRLLLWPSKPEVLPAMELRMLKVPFSAATEPPARYPDWFAALDDFRRRMEREAFDVALIGAGAWSLPLAVHAKRLGGLGIHLGGATQVLFGIKGARWDAHPVISRFYNDAWRRPSADERPAGFRAIEGGCYW